MEVHINAWGLNRSYCRAMQSLEIELKFIGEGLIVDRNELDLVDRQTEPYNGQYDNLLFFYSHIYQLINKYYDRIESKTARRPIKWDARIKIHFEFEMNAIWMNLCRTCLEVWCEQSFVSSHGFRIVANLQWSAFALINTISFDINSGVPIRRIRNSICPVERTSICHFGRI